MNGLSGLGEWNRDLYATIDESLNNSIQLVIIKIKYLIHM